MQANDKQFKRNVKVKVAETQKKTGKRGETMKTKEKR